VLYRDPHSKLLPQLSHSSLFLHALLFPFSSIHIYSCNIVPVLSRRTTQGSGELQSMSRSTVTRNGTFWSTSWRAAARLLTHATVNWLRGPLLSLNSKSLNICSQAAVSNTESDDWEHRGLYNMKELPSVISYNQTTYQHNLMATLLLSEFSYFYLVY